MNEVRERSPNEVISNGSQEKPIEGNHEDTKFFGKGSQGHCLERGGMSPRCLCVSQGMMAIDLRPMISGF